jgi:hypothetical protein
MYLSVNKIVKCHLTGYKQSYQQYGLITLWIKVGVSGSKCLFLPLQNQQNDELPSRTFQLQA